jgi:hypothetical protein
LRQGGTLVIDDLHIYTCQTIARFLQVDAAWRVEVLTKRVAFAVKLDDTGGVDGEWHLQPFVRQRSRATSYVARLVTSLGLY